MNETIIIGTWALGTGYRECVRKYILDIIASKNSYDVKIVLMTDVISEFDDMISDGYIDHICSLKQLQYDNSIIIEDEMIPMNAHDPEYREEIKTSLREKGQAFSYNARRYLFIKMAELGYTKFFIIDPDHSLLFNEELCNHLNIPINTVSGIFKEIALVDHTHPQPHNFKYTLAFGGQSLPAYCDFRLIMYRLYQELNESRFPDSVVYNGVVLTEGPLRYYNFESVQTVIQFFKYWDTAVQLFYATPEFRYLLTGTGWIMSDFMSFSVACTASKLQIINFPIAQYTSTVYQQYRIT